MSDVFRIPLTKVAKYSVETLIHYICTQCGQSWTISVDTEYDHPNIPESAACPKCKYEFYQFDNITENWNYCPTHNIWYHDPECQVCLVKSSPAYDKGYLDGLHDKPILMELPGE